MAKLFAAQLVAGFLVVALCGPAAAQDDKKAEAKKEGAPKLSKLEVVSATHEPPAVKFTVQIDLAPKAKIDEMWASVGHDKGHEVIDILAGALRQGVLEVNGFSLGSPPENARFRRCTLTKKDGAENVYEGEISYPKLKLDKAETPFFILLADQDGRKSNHLGARVHLKTGKVVGDDKGKGKDGKK